MKRIGVLGAGGMGATHVRHYSALGNVELAVFDPSPGKAASLCGAGQCTPFDSLDQLFTWADAIDVCTPTPTHADLALKAIAAGKAVLVEKPLATNLEQAAQIVKAADAARVPLAVGQVVRYFPEFRTANRLVTEGKLGKPAAVRMRRGGGAPKSEWFLDHTQSGGILVDLAVHDFDWLRWTLGEVSHLFARSVGAKTNRGPDYALTTLTFDSGAVAHVESSWMDPAGGRVTLEVCGSEGMIQFDSRQAAIVRTSNAGGTRLESPLSGSDDPYRRQMADFVGALDTGKAKVTGYDGFMALSIGLAARESALTGKVISPRRDV